MTTLQPVFALNGTIEKKQKYVVAIINLGSFSGTSVNSSSSSVSGSSNATTSTTSSSSSSTSKPDGTTESKNSTQTGSPSESASTPSPTASASKNVSMSLNQTQVLHFLGTDFTANFSLDVMSILTNNTKALVEYLPATAPNGTLPDRYVDPCSYMTHSAIVLTVYET